MPNPISPAGGPTLLPAAGADRPARAGADAPARARDDRPTVKRIARADTPDARHPRSGSDGRGRRVNRIA